MKKWNIYLIHHSHTDIGYTERQEKLMKYHSDFILQAIAILDGIHSGKIKGCGGFKWQCENQWQIENFYRNATNEQKKSFEKYVQSDEIGLSGNYLNMTELVDYDVLSSRIHKTQEYGKRIGKDIKSGMSADVNGYAWGYADALYENGVENLYCNLHPHHGMFPLHKKQQPFFWKTPKGNKVLTWISEHYHFGNELFFSPHAGSSYLLFDDQRQMLETKQELKTDATIVTEVEISVCTTRLKRYLENLEKEEYNFDFVPFMVSGAITDNAPPSAAIAKRVHELNKIFAGEITVKMVTLEEFFAIVRQHEDKIKTYEGDFTDWWADGVGSTPHTVKLFREAQRKYAICKKIDPDTQLGNKDLIEKAAENIMLYAEHTWGYSSSVTEPWDTLVSNLEKKKDAYAINANTEIAQNLDIVLSKLGEVSISVDRAQRYKVKNPHTIPYQGIVRVYIEYWEYPKGCVFNPAIRFCAFNENTGEELPCQGHQIARAFELEVFVTLSPMQEIIVELKPNHTNESTVRNHAHIGAEAVKDIITDLDETEMPFLIETPFYRVAFSPEKGIESIIDKQTNIEICDKNLNHGAFSGIYEITPGIHDMAYQTRRKMGRNRCAISTKRDISKLIDVEIIETGSVYVTAKLSYKLDGTNFYYVFLKVYKTMPLIEARVCLHKKSRWDAENLYVTLPFITDGTNETYVDKTGCIIRPGIDQLPGSCQDFYLIQNGLVRKGNTIDIIIAIKDAPLISFGTRMAKPIELCDGKNTTLNTSTAYSWVMNNFWETNFKVDLGGFHEFTYYIRTQKPTNIKNEMLDCQALNEGLLGFYI